MAQSATPTFTIDLKAQPLADSLDLLARQGKVTVDVATAAGDIVRNRTAPALSGSMNVREALRRLLAGSGLDAEPLADGRWIVRPVPAGSTTLSPVLVTGRADADVYAGGQVARVGRVGILGERDVFDTPFSVTNITAESIQNQQSRTIGQVVVDDPSVRNNGSGVGFGQDYLIRGLRVTADSVLFDGIPGLVPAYGSGTINGIDRVEIFKGPNSLLNGAGGNGLTVGGVINLVPKRAGADPVTALTANYASDSRAGGQFDLGRRFGVDGAFGARVNLDFLNGDTAIDNFSERRNSTALALDYRGPLVRVYFDAGTQQQNFRGSEPGGFLDPGTPLPKENGSGRNFLQPWGFSNFRGNFAALRSEFDIAPNLQASAVIARGTSDYRQVYSGAYFTDSSGVFEEDFQVGQGHNETLTRSASLRARFDTGPVKHEATLSFQHVKYTYAFTYGFSASDGGIDPLEGSSIYNPTYVAQPPIVFADAIPKGTQTSPTIALVDSVSWDTGRWQLIAGLRQQRLTDTRDPYDESAVTPSFALLFKPIRGVSLYGNYIQALQRGATAPSTGVTNPNEQFAPSKTRQYELGGKIDTGRLGMTAAVFDITQPTGRNVANASGLPTFVSDGQQRNRGLELGVFGAVTGGLRPHGGVTLLDARLTRTQDGALDGSRVAGVPRTTVALNADWDVPFVPRLVLTGSGQWYSGVKLYSEDTYRLRSRTDLGLGLRYAMPIAGKATTFRANVSNVLNQNRWIGDPYGDITKPAPRTLQLSSTVEF